MNTSVLITDDDAEMREELTGIFADEGCAVTTAGNGQEAFKYIMKQKFDLLILDLKMPLMSGYEVLQKMNEEKIRLKTIVLTGSILDPPMPGEKQFSYGEKKRILRFADIVMNKPFDLAKLIETAKKLVSN